MESETKERELGRGMDGRIYATPHREIECDAVTPLLIFQPLSDIRDVKMFEAMEENGAKWNNLVFVQPRA